MKEKINEYIDGRLSIEEVEPYLNEEGKKYLQDLQK